jgi:hypothetical protein
MKIRTPALYLENSADSVNQQWYQTLLSFPQTPYVKPDFYRTKNAARAAYAMPKNPVFTAPSSLPGAAFVVCWAGVVDEAVVAPPDAAAVNVANDGAPAAAEEFPPETLPLLFSPGDKFSVAIFARAANAATVLLPDVALRKELMSAT